MFDKTDIAFHEVKSPLAVHLEITSACNHNCIHCYNHWREAKSPTETLRRENIQHIIENLAMGELQDLIITGGEPLLFPDLVFEAIDVAQKAKIKCYLNTNLTYMTDEIASGLAARDVSILTSFPSCVPSIFDEIVCVEGAFDRAINGIKLAQHHGIHVAANMVVMNKNKEQVLDTGRFIHSLGIKNFTATKVHPSQTSKKFSELQLSPLEVKKLFDDLLTLKEECGLVVDTLTCYPMCLFGDISKYGELLIKRSCSAGKTAGAIGADGGVRPCSHSDEAFGNILNESILDIWPRMKAWRDGSLIPDECRACEWIRQCGAGCRMDSKFFNRRLDRLDPYVFLDGRTKISMPKCSQGGMSVSDDLPLMVNPRVRFRKEAFGTFVSGQYGSRLVTIDSEELLRSYAGKKFTLREVLNNYDLDHDTTMFFFTELLREGILNSAEDAVSSLYC